MVQKKTAPRPAQKPAKKVGPSNEPLPTNEGTPEQTKAELTVKEQLEAKRKRLKERKEALEKEAKELREVEEKLRKAKKAEKEAALKERDEKKKAIEEADATIAKCQEALDKKVADLPEAKALEAAKKRREAIGPLPKVRKSGGGGGTKRTRGAGDLNGSELRAMKAIAAAGHAMTRKELSEETGQQKGWSKLLGTKEGGNGGLCDRGLLKCVQHEEEPMRYALTDAGKEALTKAEAEAKDKE